MKLCIINEMIVKFTAVGYRTDDLKSCSSHSRVILHAHQ